MNTKAADAFKLKAHYFPITVIKFTNFDSAAIREQLSAVKQLAPNYLQHAPVVLDACHLQSLMLPVNLQELCDLLREYQLIPIGVQGLPDKEEKIAQQMGLAVWRHNITEKKPKSGSPQQDTMPQINYKNLVISKPVRSGTHVYAENSHLTLLAPVSSGAECIADGDIHCYAPVRGRLLAGAKDNQGAQIFCQNLEAELISIAGYYMTFEEYPQTKAGYLQISLNNHAIEIQNFLVGRSDK